MKTVVLFLVFILSYSVKAGTSQPDVIARISASDDSVSIIWPKNTWGESAENDCSTGTRVIAINTSTEAGKTMLSLAVAAQMSGKRVTIVTHNEECIPVGGLAPAARIINVFSS